MLIALSSDVHVVRLTPVLPDVCQYAIQPWALCLCGYPSNTTIHCMLGMTPPPSLLGQIKPIRAQTTIRWRDRTFGSTRDRVGGHGSDPLCPLFDFGQVAAPGGPGPSHRSPGGRKATKTPKQQSIVIRRRARAAGGRRGVYEYSKKNKIDLNFINCN